MTTSAPTEMAEIVSPALDMRIEASIARAIHFSLAKFFSSSGRRLLTSKEPAAGSAASDSSRFHTGEEIPVPSNRVELLFATKKDV